MAFLQQERKVNSKIAKVVSLLYFQHCTGSLQAFNRSNRKVTNLIQRNGSLVVNNQVEELYYALIITSIKQNFARNLPVYTLERCSAFVPFHCNSLNATSLNSNQPSSIKNDGDGWSTLCLHLFVSMLILLFDWLTVWYARWRAGGQCGWKIHACILAMLRACLRRSAIGSTRKSTSGTQNCFFTQLVFAIGYFRSTDRSISCVLLLVWDSRLSTICLL